MNIKIFFLKSDLYGFWHLRVRWRDIEQVIATLARIEERKVTNRWNALVASSRVIKWLKLVKTLHNCVRIFEPTISLIYKTMYATATPRVYYLARI